MQGGSGEHTAILPTTVIFTPELEKGVDDMCNLSAGIEKKGITEGENRLSKLIAHLLKIGRNDEIKAATESKNLEKSSTRNMA